MKYPAVCSNVTHDGVEGVAALALLAPREHSPRFDGIQVTQMAIHLTLAARARAHHFLAQSPEAIGIRFGVQRTGCSGWGYHIALAYERREDDQVFDVDGVAIYIDPDSLPLVTGTQIDYGKQGLGETFIYHNPNALAYCGCGESFSASPAHVPAQR